MPYACIYVPNFPVAAALRAEPDLQDCALAIFEGKPPLEKIIAVNQKAAGLSIVPGMTKAQAELCSDLVLRLRSPLQEASAHAALLDCAQSFSPSVEDAAHNTALLDLAGMQSLLGSMTDISLAIANRAQTLGLAANVATASNPDAALLAARGFAGVTVIPIGKESEKLGSLPTTVLLSEAHDPLDSEDRTADHLLETLDRWGVRTLRALAALPPVSLSERLGQQGLRLQQLAGGGVSRTLVPVEDPMTFEEAVELDHPVTLLEPLAFLLHRLLEQVCARLAARALATQELRLTLELSTHISMDDDFENTGIPSESDKNLWGQPSSAIRRSEAPMLSGRQTKFVRKLTLPLPMLDAKVFLKLLQLDLNAHPPGAPIMKIHLAAEPARPRSAQGGLFLPPAPEPEKLELTLARIAGIVGQDKVGAVELLDTHHPNGFRMRRFVAEVARKLSPEKSPKTTRESDEKNSTVTALRRFRPPLRINIKLENGQPVSLASRKKELQGEILWKAGPWRFSGDWWERDAWSRDEWDIALRRGESLALYRLVHDVLEGGWFIEGTYD